MKTSGISGPSWRHPNITSYTICTKGINMTIGESFSDFYKGLSRTLIFFFEFAWMSRIRLPAYLTLIFLAADIRLSVEIVIDGQRALDEDND
ncbi:hypothetical protein RRG08_044623 [Elysia crispata]|uniref:Uncharacterized protein n=1 Tax=Elysia crispata TaxID=231223 RepID=A0AAE0YN16_9GAST|nr:hypothetical protein RRG08_044623 [Elysia crispata]